MGPALIQFKVFIGEVSNGKKSVLSKCACDAKLKGTESTLANRVRVQNYFNKLEKWSEKNRPQCSRAVGKFLRVSKKKKKINKANAKWTEI